MPEYNPDNNIVELNRNRTYAGRFLLHLQSVESTNSYCLEDSAILNTPGLVVMADRQTRGRGSRGRSWEAGSGRHLFASLVIHPDMDTRLITCMTVFAGLAVFRAISAIGAKNVSIKWPNDILLAEKKVCGILCESRIDSSLKAVVAGIGINISGTSSQFPGHLRKKAATLSEHGITVSRKELLETICGQLDSILQKVRTVAGLEEVLRHWEKASSSMGRKVRFKVGSNEETAIVEGLDHQGHLVVKKADGSLICIRSGRIDYVQH